MDRILRTRWSTVEEFTEGFGTKEAKDIDEEILLTARTAIEEAFGAAGAVFFGEGPPASG